MFLKQLAKHKIMLMAMAILAILATPSFAMTEYIVYNGYQPLAIAFKKAALIFSDQQYRGLFFSVAVLGVAITGMKFYFGGMMDGGKGNPLAWIFPPIAGMVLFLTLIVPPGKLASGDQLDGGIMIRDEVLNVDVQIEGIPVLLELIAGTVNSIEVGLIEIVETSNAIDSVRYTGAAGGANLRALMELHRKAGMTAEVRQSLQAYTEDCFVFEMSRPGNTISLEGMRKGSQDLTDALETAASPSVFTTTWVGGATGATVSCYAAWEGIWTAMVEPTYQQEIVKQACKAALYSPRPQTFSATGAPPEEDVSACMTAMNSAMRDMIGLGAGWDIAKMNTQMAAAKVMFDVMQTDDAMLKSITQANQQMTSGGFGIGVTANEWVPIIRGILISIIIMITPILLIFTPSPLFGQIFGMIFGFFLWIMLWGVIDAMIHGMFIEYAIGYFSQLPRDGMGFEFHMQFPTQAEKVLSMLGSMRSAGVMLATIVAGAISKFAGGHAAAMLAGNFMGGVQSAGMSAGSNAIETEKAAQQKSTFESAGASHAMYSSGQFDYDRHTAGKAASGIFSREQDATKFSGGMGAAASMGRSEGTIGREQTLGRGDALNQLGSDAFRESSGKGTVASTEMTNRTYTDLADAQKDAGVQGDLKAGQLDADTKKLGPNAKNYAETQRGDQIAAEQGRQKAVGDAAKEMNKSRDEVASTASEVKTGMDIGKQYGDKTEAEKRGLSVANAGYQDELGWSRPHVATEAEAKMLSDAGIPTNAGDKVEYSMGGDLGSGDTSIAAAHVTKAGSQKVESYDVSSNKVLQEDINKTVRDHQSQDKDGKLVDNIKYDENFQPYRHQGVETTGYNENDLVRDSEGNVMTYQDGTPVLMPNSHGTPSTYTTTVGGHDNGTQTSTMGATVDDPFKGRVNVAQHTTTAPNGAVLNQFADGTDKTDISDTYQAAHKYNQDADEGYLAKQAALLAGADENMANHVAAGTSQGANQSKRILSYKPW